MHLRFAAENNCVKNLASGASASCNHDSTSKPGSPKHTCTCPKGYVGDGKGGAGSGCKDINACIPNRCAFSYQDYHMLCLSS